MGTAARANRAFLTRVVRYLATEAGIRQFLDIGTGLPGQEGTNTHEAAQQVDPDYRVVYADNDPLVLVHARALLASTPPGTCDYVDADLLEPETIVAQAARTLDLTQPATILLLAVLHFIPDAAGPAEIVAALASALAPGSYVAISHLTGDLAPEQVSAAAEAYNKLAPAPVTARTHAQVTVLFGGLPLLAPGVVPVTEWRPAIGTRSASPPTCTAESPASRKPGCAPAAGHDRRPGRVTRRWRRCRPSTRPGCAGRRSAACTTPTARPPASRSKAKTPWTCATRSRPPKPATPGAPRCDPRVALSPPACGPRGYRAGMPG